MTTKTKILLVILGFISGCVDPYVAKLSGYESLIVVDALLTDGEEPSTVHLSRSFQNQNEPPMMVIGAEVSITDGNGNQTILMEYSPGK